ncbi:MAG: hypothetical protein AAF471_07205, partial [Myxococcota bacterium]
LRKMAIFAQGVSLSKALELLRRKKQMPTPLTSREIEELSVETRQRALFSARVENTVFLDRLKTGLEEILAGRLNEAGLKSQLRELVESTDPSALRTDPRLNLIVSHNLRALTSGGELHRQQDPIVARQYPARRFYRRFKRQQPRDWVSRWATASAGQNGVLAQFLAMLDSPVWRRLNRFGTDHAPFDFNSGKDTKPVSRRQLIAEGHLAEGDNRPPDVSQKTPLNRNLQARPPIKDNRFREALEQSGLGNFDTEGNFTPTFV